MAFRASNIKPQLVFGHSSFFIFRQCAVIHCVKDQALRCGADLEGIWEGNRNQSVLCYKIYFAFKRGWRRNSSDLVCFL